MRRLCCLACSHGMQNACVQTAFHLLLTQLRARAIQTPQNEEIAARAGSSQGKQPGVELRQALLSVLLKLLEPYADAVQLWNAAGLVRLAASTRQAVHNACCDRRDNISARLSQTEICPMTV